MTLTFVAALCADKYGMHVRMEPSNAFIEVSFLIIRLPFDLIAHLKSRAARSHCTPPHALQPSIVLVNGRHFPNDISYLQIFTYSQQHFTVKL